MKNLFSRALAWFSAEALHRYLCSLFLIANASVICDAALPANRDTTFQTQPMDGLPNASIVLPDGKILIVGSFQTIGGVSRRAVARLNSDGTLDQAFAPSITGPGAFGKPIANALVRQADGRFIVAGAASFGTTDVVRTNIVRFNEDGTVDASFDANGVGHYAGLAVQADGKIVFTSNAFKPVRLNADGSPDSTFNYTSGIQAGLFGLQMFSQSDGHTVVLAGDNNPNSGGISHLVWLKSDGSKDTAFKFPFPPNQLQDESRFAVAADGTMLVAGYDSSSHPMAMKVAADGTVNTAFTYLTAPNNQNLYPVPAALLPDGGAILVRNPTAGDRRVSFFYLTTNALLAAQRDLPGVASDNGVVGVGVLPARAFAMQPDGKLLFAEAFLDGGQNVFGMFRLAAPPVPALPIITLQPSTQEIGAGDSLFLGVTATSESPLTYQWQHATTNLTGQTFQSLNLGFNSLERAGDFVVIVGNAFGAVTSQVATVTVRTPAPPTITQQPVGGSVRLSVAFTLSARCSSEVTPGAQWFKDGVAIPTGKSQGTLASLYLAAYDSTRAGDYFVVFTNTFGGAATSSIVHLDLVLPGPPVFTAQPQDSSLFSDQPVQLSAAVLADGAPTYQWRHAGTNLTVSATIPSVNAAQLYVNASDLNRAGEYDLIATVTPGGSVTSRVVTVTLQSSGLPIILTQPLSFNTPLGQATNVYIGFNGEAPLGLFLQHEGTNLFFPQQLYPSLAAAVTNAYAINSLVTDSGRYQFIITNRFGSVTSIVATVSVQTPPPAALLADLPDTVVGIGEFNFTSLREGLVMTNLSFPDTTHILEMNVSSGLPPFSAAGAWQLALGSSNLFYVAANGATLGATGTWAFASAAPGYTAFALTNFPRFGDISRLEAFEDGHYGIILGGNVAQTQAGTYRVLGARRPATNVFSIDLASANGVQVEWLKDGVSLNTGNRVYVTATKSLGLSTTGVGTNRFTLTLPDVTPADVGSYSARITNTFPNPDHSFGQPPNIVTSVTSTRSAALTVRGYSETNAPAVVSVFELGSATAKDEPTAISGLDDGSILLGLRTTVFGGNSSVTDTLSSLSSTGQTNWQTFGLPAQIRAILPDGQGGAFVGGHNDTAGDFYLNRVHPSGVLSPGKTYYSATNLWAVSAAGPSTNAFENSTIVHGAEVTGLLSSTDGVIVAGRFRGKTRFGATNVVVIPNILFSPVGGTTLTNVFDATYGRNDGSWDLFVAKYDFTGQLLWARGYGGTNNETLTSLTSDSAGNLYLAGTFQGGAAFGSLSLESTKTVTQGLANYAIDGFVAKLAANGTPTWVRNFGGLSSGFLANTFVPTATADADGNFYFVGVRNQVTATLQVGMTVGARYLARLNPSGDLQWAQTLVTVGNTDSFSGVGNCRLALDSGGNVVLIDAYQNKTPAILGGGTLDQRLASGALVAKFSTGGTLLWARALDEKLPFADDPRSANARLIAVTPTGEVVIAGSFAGGPSSGGTRLAGQRFDNIELSTTNNATSNPTDVFVARLAPAFAPAAPLLTMLSAANRSGLLQDAFSLEGKASGVPAPIYQWLLNGVPVANATNRFLIFTDLERSNGGTYTLTASNSFGVASGNPIQVTPQLRPSMTDWTLVTATTNYVGLPTRIAADDDKNSYILLDGSDLRRFDATGQYTWRFDTGPRVETMIDGKLNSTFLLTTTSPVVAPSGEVFVAGRLIVQQIGFSSTAQGNFIGRLDPATGGFIWVKALSSIVIGQLDSSTIRALDLDGAGHVRALISDKHIRVFSFDGTEAPPATLATLPVLTDSKNYQIAIDSAGGLYFYANRAEALSLGATNLPALNSLGAQSYVLARYDAAGVYQWHREFAGPGGLVFTPSVHADANGNAIVSGGLSLLGAQTLQIGTNILTGSGYAAKVSQQGDVLWAKAWWLDVCDSAVKADGSVYLTGWFRFAPANTSNRKVPFGTNVVSGSSITGHDQFIAKLDADGHEQFIRQTGGTQFYTEDNATAYRLTVDTKGIVTTAGYTRVPRAGGSLDVGAVQMIWPAFPPTSSEYQAYYVARLEAGLTPAGPIEIQFTPPQPGATTLQLSWPTGYSLQRRTDLSVGAWETLNVSSPYNASVSEFTQGYFRVVSAP